ncbi:MAG: SRPBCC family protein [Opitutus sp.]
MHTTHSRVRLAVSREKAWAALTRPDLVAKWQYGSALTTTWEVGSRIVFRAEWEGQVFEQWGEVLEYREPERLRYRLFAPRPDLVDRPENYFEMIYSLESREGGTLVTITQHNPRPLAGEPEPETPDEANPVLQALKSVAKAL